jgi:outer membrane protein OmpA-like peptidoglycan-associated protein/opacity protein-like surface antigen
MKRILSLLLAVLIMGTAAMTQDLGGAVAIGVRGGATSYQGDDFDSAKLRPYGSLLGENYLNNYFSIETALNIGQIAGETGAQSFRSQLSGLSLLGRLAPFGGHSLRPYLAGGAEFVGIDPKGSSNVGFDRKMFAIPAGGGLSIGLSENTALDFRGLYHIALKDRADGLKGGSDDSFLSGTVGLSWLIRSNKDPDGDGLFNSEEKARGTNPKLADSDGDGLTDGEEVLTYNTDPLKSDSDADGLADADEIKKYKSNPNKADSDGDGLADGEEMNKHKTDLLKADSDNDGLSDGEEVNNSKTNPLVADTDADGLNDGDEVKTHKTDALKADTDADDLKDGVEVSQYRTNPLKADTDEGTVTDGVEVKRGTNPLVADDDLPKKEILRVETGAPIVLEGVVFKTGSAAISPESEAILVKAFNTIEAYPAMTVEIHGHTDNTGSTALNTKLSLARAEAVKAWLVNKGISAGRIAAKGFGPDKPIAPNDTKEGRQKNRRIEFVRTN